LLKLALKHQANQANQLSLKGEGLIECKISSQKFGLIGLEFRSSLNQALAFSLIVDKSAPRELLLSLPLFWFILRLGLLARMVVRVNDFGSHVAWFSGSNGCLDGCLLFLLHIYFIGFSVVRGWTLAFLDGLRGHDQHG
jgi:hypothetical protein